MKNSFNHLKFHVLLGSVKNKNNELQNDESILATKNLFKIVIRAAASCIRMERRNRSLHGVNEDFEHRPSANGGGVVDLEQVLRRFSSTQALSSEGGSLESPQAHKEL